MALILSANSNPGVASWSSAAGSTLAQNRFGFVGAGGTINATESFAIYTATDATDVNITVSVAPTFAGQLLTFLFVTDGGGNTVVTFPAALNSAGNTIVTMNDANDSFGVIGVTVDGNTYRWVPMFNNGCTLS